MRTLALCAALLLSSCGGGGSSSAGPYEKNRDPRADVKAALELAKATNKRVLVEAGGNWCPWCLKLDKFYKSHETVGKARDEGFVLVHVAVDADKPMPAPPSGWPAPAGFPHFWILDPDGTVVKSQNTAELEAGETYDTVKLILFLASNAPKKS